MIPLFGMSDVESCCPCCPKWSCAKRSLKDQGGQLTLGSLGDGWCSFVRGAVIFINSDQIKATLQSLQSESQHVGMEDA